MLCQHVHLHFFLVVFSYDEVLLQASQDLQPKHLVNFLLKLRWETGLSCDWVNAGGQCLSVFIFYSHFIASAHRDLPVKGSPPDVAQVEKFSTEQPNKKGFSGTKTHFLMQIFKTLMYPRWKTCTQQIKMHLDLFFTLIRRGYASSGGPAPSWPLGCGSLASRPYKKCDSWSKTVSFL